MNKISIGVFAAMLMAGPAAAQSFKATNGVIVRPAGNGFSVTGDGGFGARGIWCAAADYALRNERARNAQRLYISKPRKPGLGQRDPITFTLNPQGLTPVSASILGASLRQKGANLSVGHAIGFCADHKLTRGGRG
ncbi:hypothetical protein [Sulfitobacter donghicola]|uniref:Uncharacterized protein n=2 Tax=Sulfitobacter TaxID=60136 RepID=A0A073II86_9RHOB|nr:hypothetical protein [Sulfitobacter donghicola]KEJ89285.1 hypothetical protein DSW25_09690 [Sulfitobacter donghicola DSW-25 = KCTC 12864 = JCM 14565]